MDMALGRWNMQYVHDCISPGAIQWVLVCRKHQSNGCVAVKCRLKLGIKLKLVWGSLGLQKSRPCCSLSLGYSSTTRSHWRAKKWVRGLRLRITSILASGLGTGFAHWWLSSLGEGRSEVQRGLLWDFLLRLYRQSPVPVFSWHQ